MRSEVIARYNSSFVVTMFSISELLRASWRGNVWTKTASFGRVFTKAFALASAAVAEMHALSMSCDSISPAGGSKEISFHGVFRSNSDFFRHVLPLSKFICIIFRNFLYISRITCIISIHIITDMYNFSQFLYISRITCIISIHIAIISISPIPFQGCTGISCRRGYSVQHITVREGDALHCGHLHS